RGVSSRARRRRGRAGAAARAEGAFARAEHEHTCVLYTLLGAAGVGKSRLVDELLAKLDGPLVARGRCLSYGAGITHFPVVDVLKQLLGPDPETRLGELTPDAGAPYALRGLIGTENLPRTSPAP